MASRKKEEEHVLEDLLVVQLRGMYDVETQLAKTLPRIIKKVTNTEFKESLEQYRAQTEHYVGRLEEVFAKLEVKPQKLPSAAIRGLMEDADWIAKNIMGAAAVDVGLAAVLQGVQRYRFALYGTAFAWAKLLEIQGIVDILEESMHDADESIGALDEIAESKLNKAAVGEEDDEEAEGEEEEEDPDDED